MGPGGFDQGVIVVESHACGSRNFSGHPTQSGIEHQCFDRVVALPKIDALDEYAFVVVVLAVLVVTQVAVCGLPGDGFLDGLVYRLTPG